MRVDVVTPPPLRLSQHRRRRAHGSPRVYGSRRCTSTRGWRCCPRLHRCCSWPKVSSSPDPQLIFFHPSRTRVGYLPELGRHILYCFSSILGEIYIYGGLFASSNFRCLLFRKCCGCLWIPRDFSCSAYILLQHVRKTWLDLIRNHFNLLACTQFRHQLCVDIRGVMRVQRPSELDTMCSLELLQKELADHTFTDLP